MIIFMIYVCLPVFTSSTPSDHCTEKDNFYTGTNNLLKSLLHQYDKNALPSSDVVNVTVEVTIQDVWNLSPVHSRVKVDLWFSQIWNDPHLKFSHLEPCRNNLSLDHNSLNAFWTPNVCFVNSKVTQLHLSPAPNILLLIFPNGTVWLNYRVQVEGPCTIDLSLFPMDTQECQLMFESYNHNSNEVHLQWLHSSPVTLTQDDYLIPEFVLYDVEPSYGHDLKHTGVWDQLIVVLRFKRKFGYYILQAYMPTCMCVMMSWLNFCLDITNNALIARVSLGVSNIMAVIVTFGNVVYDQPKVNYVRAFDVWIWGCTAFIFSTLIEVALVQCAIKFQSRQIYLLKNDGIWEYQSLYRRKSMVKPKYTLDMISVKIYPLAFLIFNFIYWSYYLSKVL